MQFSVIIPVYNVEQYLNKCIESFEKQTYKDFEVLLIDDGSTDRSSEICDKAKERNDIFKVIHKKNGGLLSARRTGIKNARGNFIINCDSDDYLEENALEIINKIILESSADIVVYNAYIVKDNSKCLFSKPTFNDGVVEKKDFIEKLFTSYSLNSMCMKAVSYQIVDRDRNYQQFYECNFGEDILQSIPILLASNKIYYTGQALYNYRLTSGMMRKYSSNYYWSYRKVNDEIRKQMKNAGIEKYKDYADFHLLNSTYGAIIQAQFLQELPLFDWRKIREDGNFISAYNNKKARERLGKKEKLVIGLFYRRTFKALYVIIKAFQRGRK